MKQGDELAVLSIGAIGNTVAEAINSIADERLKAKVAHYDMRWLKPIDEEVLATVCKKYKTIVTVEDGMIDGGLGSSVAEYVADRYTEGSQTAALLEVRHDGNY